MLKPRKVGDLRLATAMCRLVEWLEAIRFPRAWGGDSQLSPSSWRLALMADEAHKRAPDDRNLSPLRAGFGGRDTHLVLPPAGPHLTGHLEFVRLP
jgi:hypothetical protein